MASGTLAQLAIVLGIDDRAVTSGLARARANILTNLKGIGTQAARDAAAMEARITQSGAATANALSRGPIALAVGIGAATAGLGALAVQFETEAAHIAASMNIPAEAAREISKAFIDMAGNERLGGAGAIFT